MNKPHELLFYLFQQTGWGASWVGVEDLPDVLANVYGDPSGQDQGALLACNGDMDALVRLGDVQKHERNGLPIFVLTAPGKAKAQILGGLGTGDPTPVGPL